MEGVEPSSSLLMEKGRRFTCPVILFPGYRLAESCQEWADTLLLTRGQRFRGRTSPDCQRKRLPVELPGTVALTGGCVFRGLLVQNRRVQTVQSGLFGAVSDSGLVVLLRAAACVSLVSSQVFSPPPRRSIGYRQGALTSFQTMLLCEAWSGLDTIYGVKSRAALSTKAFTIITLIIKKCNNVLE